FAGATRADIIAAILEREAAPLFRVTRGNRKSFRDLQGIVNRALEKERDKRYQTAAEMLDDLRAFRQRLVSGNHDAINPETCVEDLHKLASRSTPDRSRWLALGAAIFIGVVLFSALVYRRVWRRQSIASSATSMTAKPYLQMTQGEQLAFID